MCGVDVDVCVRVPVQCVCARVRVSSYVCVCVCVHACMMCDSLYHHIYREIYLKICTVQVE